MFEKTIELSINKKKIRIFNKQAKNMENIFNTIKTNGFDTKKNCYLTNSNIIKFNKINNKTHNEENDKINRSYHEKGSLTLLNKDNDINSENNVNQENKVYLSEKKKLIINKSNQKIISNNNLMKISKTNDNIISLNSKFLNIFKKSVLNRRNYILKSNISSQDIDKIKSKDFSDLFFNKKVKRNSGPTFIYYDFNPENKPNNKRNKKIGIRSLSAQRYDEKDIKKAIFDNQNNYKETKKYYDNTSFFVKNNKLTNSNIVKDVNNLNILNKKKIFINKFNSNASFRRSANKRYS